MSIFNENLERSDANFQPLSPVSFLRRAAKLRPNSIAVVHGERRYTYEQFWRRSCQLASALAQRGIGENDCVAIMACNTPEMLEAHNAVPLLGAVLNSLNIRLDAATIAFILNHGEAKVLITDTEFSPVVKDVLDQLGREILVIDIDDSEAQGTGERLGQIDYEALLTEGDSAPIADTIRDEWHSISLLYTSGTTGNPKGCVYHHRGAYLNAIGNMTTIGLTHQSRYLWTLPMFHCDGWTFTWGVTAAMATHICLRKVEPKHVFELIEQHDVTHMCGAPIVLNMLANAPKEIQRKASQPIEIATGGAAPPSVVIESMEAIGFNVTHLYGLTECYGPATVCLPQDDWSTLSLNERSARIARQGVHYLTLEDATVVFPETMLEVPRDASTIGELVLRGNTVMKGYLKNQTATDEAFAGGWYRTLEVEEQLYRHPKVLEAAVVAKPDETWGETPCAFVTLHEGQVCTEEEIIQHCRDSLAKFKVPKTVQFGTLPKTSTGKIQKFTLRDKAKMLP